MPDSPWTDIAVDLLGPVDGVHVLVVIDYYSHYYEMEFMKSTNATYVIQCFKAIFARHGLPLSITSDNGPPFNSAEYKQYQILPSYSANGDVERQNQSLEKRMRIAKEEGRDWQDAVITYVGRYRATPHSTTGATPAKLLFNRKIHTKLPAVTELIYDQEVRDCYD